MLVTDFDYSLPKELIALKPTECRESSKLLALNRKTGQLSHHIFYDISAMLTDKDVLVFNNSKVFPARLFGQKQTGGKIELLLNQEDGNQNWEVIGKNLKVGDCITFENSSLSAMVLARKDQEATIKFNLNSEALLNEIERIGHIPLPPYIEAGRRINHTKYDLDKVRYQTVYAKKRGSVAAPTAGLHFSNKLISSLKKKILLYELTLNVGLGTFAPVKTNIVEKHQIHKEYFHIDKRTFNDLLKLKRSGHRIIAVGTTTTRVLESIYQDYPNTVEHNFGLSGFTDIYIYPGYDFRFIDGLITNFHLPKSSLLFLVSAFGGKENVFKAYQEAIDHKYRFYSYGDAMFIR